MPRGCEEADERCPALALCLGTAAWWFVGLCCFPLIISQPALGCGSSASWGVPTANPLTVSFGLRVLQTGPSADDALSNPEGHLSKAKGWCFNALVELSLSQGRFTLPLVTLWHPVLSQELPSPHLAHSVPS